MVNLQEMFRPPKIYGTVTVGTKGQIVLPNELRKRLNIEPGDQFFVVLKFDQVIGLIKANDFEELHHYMEREFALIHAQVHKKAKQ